MMSADNWRICPKCTINHENDLIKKRKKIEKTYGKVSAMEYEREISELNRSPEMTEVTLREDYEFSMEGFNLQIDYSCHCSRCGLEFSYDENIDISNKELKNEP